MSAWGASPYRAIGLYIGGANEACSQPNLSPTWVQQESAAGWVLLPIYVGLQAPKNGCGCAGIVASQASAEGTAAAIDAVNQAEANGIGPGNPIYDDMEAYTRGSTNTPAVLAFLSAWTTQLHAHGYTSGVYSSANSGIADFVAANGNGFVEPDQIWIADWNGQQNTNSSVVPSSEWANHQRIHQYQGGHNATYGGATINIDSDYVDAGAASGNVLFPNGTFVQVSGSTAFYEIAGGAPLFVSDWSDVGGAQPYTVITPQQFAALNPVPSDGTLVETNTGALYLVAGGAPMFVTNLAQFGNPQPFLVDAWDIANAGNPASHLNAVPSNGTFLTTTTGLTYRVAGGRPDRRHKLVRVRGREAGRDDRSVRRRQHLEPGSPSRLPAGRWDGRGGAALRSVLGVRAEEPLPGPAEPGRRRSGRRPRPRAVLGHPLPRSGPRSQDARAGQGRADEGRLPPRQGA